MKSFSFLLCALFFLCASPVFSQEEKPKEGDLKKFEDKVKQQIEKRIVKEAKAKAEGVPMPTGILILNEFIEVESEQFSDWAIENPLLTDASDLRQEVQKWVKTGDANIVETLVVHARSGNRAKVESISEFIYPTEYDPPQGASNQESGDQPYSELIPPTPAAFETRNVGTTLEVDPVLGADGVTIDLNLAPEIVIKNESTRHTSKLGDTEMTVETPNFLTSKITTQVTLLSGTYAFLGTSRLGKTTLPDAKDPILLIFVRADASGGE